MTISPSTKKNKRKKSGIVDRVDLITTPMCFNSVKRICILRGPGLNDFCALGRWTRCFHFLFYKSAISLFSNQQFMVFMLIYDLQSPANDENDIFRYQQFKLIHQLKHLKLEEYKSQRVFIFTCFQFKTFISNNQ